MKPTPPRDPQVFTRTRNAGFSIPKARIASSSREWMDTLWPSPPNFSISMARSQPSRHPSTTMKPSTVVSFSRDSGCLGPMPSRSATRMRADSGTGMPTFSPMYCGVRPTRLATIRPFGRNITEASLSASSLVSQWAPWACISAFRRSAIGASAMTACSVAQMVEQSKDFDSTIILAALAMWAVRST